MIRDWNGVYFVDFAKCSSMWQQVVTLSKLFFATNRVKNMFFSNTSLVKVKMRHRKNIIISLSAKNSFRKPILDLRLKAHSWICLKMHSNCTTFGRHLTSCGKLGGGGTSIQILYLL